MPFQEVGKVVYAKNPLEVVICQVRFHPILRIQAELPSVFQDSIRRDYPVYTKSSKSNIPGEFARFLSPEISFSEDISHEFSDESGNWTVSLTKEFLALTCKRYLRWAHFDEQLSKPLKALIDIYEPPVFTRLGLRYRDVIYPGRLGLGNNWGELLKPVIAGALSDPSISGDVQVAKHQIGLALNEVDAQVLVRYGLLQNESHEQGYYIDADFFTTRRTEPKHARSILDEFHKHSYQLLRWCITDKLHEAMEPEPTT